VSAETIRLEIATPDSSDKLGWRALFQAYLRGLEMPVREEIVERAWAWLADANHPLEALMARTADGEPVGFVHFRAFPDPLTAKVAGTIEDVFVLPHHRGSGAAEALIAVLSDTARKRRWIGLQWQAPEMAYRARGLFDKVAVRTKWAIYEMELQE